MNFELGLQMMTGWTDWLQPLLAMSPAAPAGGETGGGGHGGLDVFRVLAVVLLASVVVSLIFHRVRQSLLLGYLLCGILIGPRGMGWIADSASISVMAEVGVVLLMFSIGIEFSLGELRSLKRVVLLGAPIQLGLTGLVAGGIAMFSGLPFATALLVALIFSISSTALVLKLFQEGGANVDLATRFSVGIAIVQDIAVIVFMIALPTLFPAPVAEGGTAPNPWVSGGLALGKGAAFLVVSGLLARYVIPPLLRRVSQTGSRELFTLTVLALCVGIAQLSGLFGLGFPLGAFVAGIIVSDTIYSHRILADILPFKDFFLTLFFVSVGMLLDVQYMMGHWWTLLLAAAGVLLVKSIVAFGAGLASDFPLRPSLLAGLGLACMSEFGFLLLREAERLHAMPASWQQFLLVLTIVTMGLTPFYVKLHPKIAKALEKLPPFHPHAAPTQGRMNQRVKRLEDHAIICGYGPIGQKLCSTLNHHGVQTVVIELNAKTVEELMATGQNCLFADATQTISMELARLEHARLLAITFPGVAHTEAIIHVAKAMRPEIVILCRARFPSEAAHLRSIGADIVIHEEIATSAAIIQRALNFYDCEEEEIEATVRRLQYESGGL